MSQSRMILQLGHKSVRYIEPPVQTLLGILSFWQDCSCRAFVWEVDVYIHLSPRLGGGRIAFHSPHYSAAHRTGGGLWDDNRSLGLALDVMM